MKLYKHAIAYKWTAEEFIAAIKLIKSTDFKVEDVNVDLHKRVAAAIAQGHFTSYNMWLFTSHNMQLWLMKHLSRAFCIPLFARARNAACRARSFIPTERMLQDRARRTKAQEWSSNCERSRIELAEPSTRQPPAQLSGTELPPAFWSLMIQISLSWLILWRTVSPFVFWFTTSLSWEIRIRINLLHGVAEKTDCTTHFFFVPVRAGLRK